MPTKTTYMIAAGTLLAVAAINRVPTLRPALKGDVTVGDFFKDLF